MDAPDISPDQLKQGVVITAESWPVPLKQKLLAAPAIGIDVRFAGDDLEGLPGDQLDVFCAAFGERFASPFQLATRSSFSEMRKVVRVTEAAIGSVGRSMYPARTKQQEMMRLVDEANAELARRCGALADDVQALARTSYVSAIAASYRRTRRRAVKPTAAPVARIGLATPLAPAVLTTVSVVRAPLKTPAAPRGMVTSMPRLRP
ncbi:MAG TPA: hypothetical protein VE442_16460 [Jatrophihabitans sp.]|jgi:hypothetical protein|nr:hypothetical protein [Jatrophihabitans sp.]